MPILDFEEIVLQTSWEYLFLVFCLFARREKEEEELLMVRAEFSLF